MFDEEGLLSNLPTKVEEHSHQNINTNLLMPLNISHRKEYKGPITRERVRKLDEDATIQSEVTHYHHQIPFKSSVRHYHPNQPSKDEDDEQQQQQSSMEELHEINEERLSVLQLMFCHLHPLLIFPLKLVIISMTLEELISKSDIKISPRTHFFMFHQTQILRMKSIFNN